MLLSIGMMIVGLALLIKGADWLVDGASAIAQKFGVPILVIWLTIVAFGTSMPEMLVNVMSALKGNSDIAFGNVIGSSIANILLILWVTGLITTLKVQKSTTWKEIPFSLLSVLVLFVFANTTFLDGASANILTQSDGLILLLFFGIFLYYVYESTQGEIERKEKVSDKPSMSYYKLGGLIIVGLIGLYFGGTWTVDGAVAIAKHFGMSDLLISTTIISLGTSLPELVTSVAAARKGNVDLAIGNVIGSNIFNIFWILGITALINPIPFPVGADMDLLVVLIATLLLFFFMFIGKRHTLHKRQAITFVVLYVGYIVMVVLRG